LMWASGLALNGLSTAGLGKVSFPMHLIEHSLSALYDIPHGAGLALVIPGWLRFHARRIPERITAFFSQVFETTFSDKKVDTAIDCYVQWLGDLSVSTSLGDFGVSASDIDRLAENALPLARIWRMREYDREKIGAILRCCTP